ncbi:hypothetical protein ACOMHN_035681 [Nucella lapillus]
MADCSSQVADVLKRFAVKVTVSSTKERIEVIEALVSHVENGDLPEAAVKGIFRFLSSTVGRYHDAGSRRAACRLVGGVVRVFPAPTVTNIVTAFTPLAEGYKKNASPCKSSSGDSLYALTLTCVVLREILSAQSNVPAKSMQQLVGLQCVFVYGACAADRKILNQAAYRKLRRVWISVPGSLEKYLSLLEKVEASSFNTCCVAYVLQFLTGTKNKALIEQHKGAFLDLYLKQVLASRTPPPQAIVASSREIVRHCGHEDFKTLVLPATQRAMLRNPEIILSTVGQLLSQLSVDLSQYAADLGKLLGAQIVSKDESTRREAVAGVKNLAVQCSDSGAVEKLVKHFFAVLNGSEGKLTITDQKVSVLHGIGSLVHTTVSGTASLQDLATKVTTMFLPMLQQEVHEGTLVQALAMMSLWCAKFYTAVPDKLLLWFQNGLTLKSSTSAVRNAYFLCMNACFHGDTMQQATRVVPLLLQTVEKAGKQSSQPTLVTEMVSASRTLVRLASIDIETEVKLGGFWSMVLEPGKQWMVTDKFLTSASDETLCSLVAIIERLILDFPNKLTEGVSQPYYRAIIFCLTHRSWAVRSVAMPTVRKLLTMLGGASIALALIAEFKAVLETQNLAELKKQQEREDETKTGEESKVINPKILCRALLAVCSVVKADRVDAEVIAMATLLPAHHPYVVFGNQDMWVEIVQRLNLDPGVFVKKQDSKCLAFAMTGTTLPPNVTNAMETLCRVSPQSLVPPLIAYVSGLLGNPQMAHVTKEEYGIFLTPEGELYDRSIIENAMKSSGAEQNVRRENKLYSYAEQMAELELKKEMDKKKGKKTETTPKLSKKQEELLATQRQRESEIRRRLTELYHQLCCGCSLLESALKASGEECCFYMNLLCDLVVPLLPSPLAAPRVSQVFLTLGQVAFQHTTDIGVLVSNATLRLLDPACSTPREWAEEDLPAQSARTLHLLLSFTGPQDHSPDLFPASAVCFFYYLLAAVLKDGAKVVKGDEDVCSEALQLVILHAGMRRSPDLNPDTRTLMDPQLLPRQKLVWLCLSVIGTMEMDLQQRASSALLALAACANGDDGAATAAQGEVVELLKALESPCTAVREAALQVTVFADSLIPTVRRALCDPLPEVRQVAAVTFYNLHDNIGQRALDEILPYLLQQLVEPSMSEQVLDGLKQVMSVKSRVVLPYLIPQVRRLVKALLTIFTGPLVEGIFNLMDDIIRPDRSKLLTENYEAVAVIKSHLKSLKVKATTMTVTPEMVRFVNTSKGRYLTAPPVNTKALSLLTSVAGDALTRHLSKILPALLSSLSAKRGTPEEEQELEYCKKVVLSVEDLLSAMNITNNNTSDDNDNKHQIVRSWAVVTLLQAFCSSTSCDIGEYIPQLFRGLIQLFVQQDPTLLLAAWTCLDSITKRDTNSDASLDWNLRHGRCCALGVVVKECGLKVWASPLRSSLVHTVPLLAAADRIPISLGGVRAVGYLLRYLIQDGNAAAEAQSLASMLVKCLKNDSTDVKQLVGRMLTYVGDSSEGGGGGGMSVEVMRVVVPALVMGTKEKNTMVRAASESALVTLLRLRQGDTFYQSTLSSLDTGMQDSLKEVFAKSLKKLASQNDPGIDDIDDTVLR